MLATLRMIQVCDSLFPIGAFTLSNGLETLITQRIITDGDSLESYVKDVLKVLPFNDLGSMILSYDNASDPEFIRDLDQLTLALKTPEEVRTGSKKLCNRFLKICKEFEDGCDSCYPALNAYRDEISAFSKSGSCKDIVGCEGNHAIAVGLFARDIEISKDEAASIYAYSLLNAIVTNGVKMIPLSQMVGQRILSKCQKNILQAVEIASSVSIDDLGVGGAGMDIAGMKHEELYSRLYMS